MPDGTWQEPKPNGDFDLPGDLVLQRDGSVKLPNGNVFRPDGSIEMVDGSRKMRSGSVLRPDAPRQPGEMYTPPGFDPTPQVPQPAEFTRYESMRQGQSPQSPKSFRKETVTTTINRQPSFPRMSTTTHVTESRSRPSSLGSPQHSFVSRTSSSRRVLPGRQSTVPGTVETSTTTRRLPNGMVIHSDGTVEFPDGSRKHPDGTVTDRNGTVIEPGVTGCVKLSDGTTVMPDGRIMTTDGNFILPDGSIVRKDGSIQRKDGTVLPPGSTAPSYSVPGFHTSEQRIFGQQMPEGADVAPDGTTTLPNGMVLRPDGVLTMPNGAKLMPDGLLITPEGAHIYPDADGTYQLPDGAKLTKDGEVSPCGPLYCRWARTAAHRGAFVCARACQTDKNVEALAFEAVMTLE